MKEKALVYERWHRHPGLCTFLRYIKVDCLFWRGVEGQSRLPLHLTTLLSFECNMKYMRKLKDLVAKRRTVLRTHPENRKQSTDGDRLIVKSK